MSPTPPNPRRWPMPLLLLAALFPPVASWLLTLEGITIHGITDRPWVIIGLSLAYVLILIASQYGQGLLDQFIKDAVDQSHKDIVDANKFSNYDPRYQRHFLTAFNTVDVKPLRWQGNTPPTLDKVFVEPYVALKPARLVSSNPVSIPASSRNAHHDLTVWNHLKESNEHLVILGAPGSGKTTLLKHVGLSVFNKKEIRQEWLPYLVPVFLSLHEHSAAIENGNYSLADAVRGQKHIPTETMPQGWVEDHLKKGHCLILLDGLDEMANPQTRRKVAEWVQLQMIEYSDAKNRFIVTSRPNGYSANALNNVRHLGVQPFTEKQVEQFIDQWYKANETAYVQRDDHGTMTDEIQRSDDLLNYLHRTEVLSQLAVNPFLLTMILVVYQYENYLPKTRILLYREICEIYLGKRREAQGIEEELKLGLEQRQIILQELAYVMMQQRILSIEDDRAQKIIQPSLKMTGIDISPAKFLKNIEEVSGLLSSDLLPPPQVSEIYEFAHRTFQEYLAMVAIRDDHTRENDLLKRIGDPWWSEVIRLYCLQKDATPVVKAFLELADSPSTPKALLVEALPLVEDCSKNTPMMDMKFREKLNALLEQGAYTKNHSLNLQEAIAEMRLRRRLRKMDLLQGNFCCDRTLITCAEYQLFLDEKREENAWCQPDHWKEERFEAKYASLPVTGVRRSDARAFCTWLTKRDNQNERDRREQNEQDQRSVEHWHYRLPKKGEYKLEKIHSQETWKSPIGFWLEDTNRWAWIETSRQEQHFHPLYLGENYIKDINETIKVNQSELADMLDYSSKSMQKIILVLTRRDLGRFIDFISTRARLYNHAQDLTHELTRLSKLVRNGESEFVNELASASSNALTFIHEFAHIPDNNFNDSRELISILSEENSPASKLDSIRILAEELVYESGRVLDLARDHTLAKQSYLALRLELSDNDYWTHFIVLAQILALLSAGLSYFISSSSASQNVSPSSSTIQEAHNAGFVLAKDIQQLDKRLHEKEVAYEGILLIKERIDEHE